MVFGGWFFVIMTSYFFGHAEGAVEKVVKPQSYIVCKNKETVRTIRVEATNEGCEAKYTKSGVDRVIGNGSHQAACEKFVDNVKDNLEAANWRCRDVKDSKITAESAAPNE